VEVDDEVRDYLTGDLSTFGALPDLGSLVVVPAATSAGNRAAPAEVVRQDAKVTAATEVAPSAGVVREPLRLTSSSTVAAPIPPVREERRYTAASTAAAPSAVATGGSPPPPPPSKPLIPDIVFGPPPGRVIEAKLATPPSPSSQSPLPWLLIAALAGGLLWISKSESRRGPSLRPLSEDYDLDEESEDSDE